jgi:ABC-type dipeptide/oligopeptide/nickel transport system permease subunit
VTLRTSTQVIALNDSHEAAIGVGESLMSKALRRLRRDRLTMMALAVMTVFSVLAITAPLMTQYVMQVDPNSTEYEPLLPVGTAGHIFGTDDLGRDQLARLLHAGRISLGIGFFGSLITLLIGLITGMATGYFGGVFDDLMNWIITTLDSLPIIYLLIIISALFRPSPESLVAVLALTGWTGVTRLIRGQTLSIREREFILSARAIGASPWRIMLSHILPNLISVTAISLAAGIGGLILAESALSFLNLGVQPPTATWGNMLTKAQAFFVRGPHMAIVPGILIFITVLCFYIIGDGVRDAFDPTTSD